MKIGIIGAGHIGGALARRLKQIGHDVTVANSRGPETLKGLATETGARAGTVTEAIRDKDVVIVTIPEKSVPELPKGLFATSHAVVVDTGNYYPQRDGRIGAIESGTTESRWVSQQLGRPVVKAFNTIQSSHLQNFGRPAGDRERIALPIAGDRARSVERRRTVTLDPLADLAAGRRTDRAVLPRVEHVNLQQIAEAHAAIELHVGSSREGGTA